MKRRAYGAEIVKIRRGTRVRKETEMKDVGQRIRNLSKALRHVKRSTDGTG